MHKFSAFVGFDGFVDKVFHVVDQRSATGKQFKKIRTISDFAQRIASASGLSTNIELYPIEERIGGNGPILAETLANYEVKTNLWGTVEHPIFQNIQATSLGAPGITNALEFDDGKVLMGVTQPLDQITPENIKHFLEQQPPEFWKQDLFCFVNWTMIVHMNAILQHLFLPNLSQSLCFFDLADPQKRPQADLLEFFEILNQFPQHYTILGLNLKEAQQVLNCARLWKNHKQDTQIADVLSLCQAIQQLLPVKEVFIHDTRCCAACTSDESAYCDDPQFFVEKPKTTTGAGDHFNAGYLLARLKNYPLTQALKQGYSIASHFVQTGELIPIRELQ